MADYQNSPRHLANEESRAAAEHIREQWTHDEVELLMTWDRTDAELTLMAEILGRTREACRERYYLVARGAAPRSGPISKPQRLVSETVTRTVTETTTYRYSQWADGDDYNQDWYR